MKYLKYLVVCLILFLPIGVGALDGTPVLNCDKSMLSTINETTNCTLELDITSGGVKQFTGEIALSDNLIASDINISDDWTNVSSSNNINVNTDTAKIGKVVVANFKITLTNVVSGTNEFIKINNINLIDENDISLQKDAIEKKVRIPDVNADLKTLSVSTGVLSPSFDSNILEYTVDNVENANIVINASANDNASIQGTGNKNLKYGNNIFEITVKAEAGNTKTYKITVNRIDNRSNDYTIKNISVNDTVVNFDDKIKNYTIELPSTEEKVKVLVTTNSDKASVVYSSNNVSLRLDETYTIWVTVIAENGDKSSTYGLTITRKDDRSSNNNLQTLKINNEKINLTNLQAYTLTVNNNVTSAEVVATPQDLKANVKIDGNKKLKVGKNTFTITVTAENEATKTYKLTIIRRDEAGDITNLSNNSFLKQLEIDGYEIVFDKNNMSYNIEVKNDVEKLQITCTPEDDKSEVSIDGNKDFQEGINVVNILVTAENGETSNYIINVNKLGKNYKVANTENKIIEALKNKQEYEQVMVDVKVEDEKIISTKVLQQIVSSRKLITYSVIDNSLIKYSIILNGSSFTEVDKDINYQLEFTTNDTNINDLIGNKKHVVLDFSNKESFPSATMYKIYVGDKFTEQDSLYIYVYNENNELKIYQKEINVESGYIMLQVEKGNTYVVLNIDLEKKDNDVVIDVEEDKPVNMMYIYIGGGLLLILILIIIIFSKKKKKTSKKPVEEIEIVEDINNQESINPIGNTNNLELTGSIDIIDVDENTSLNKDVDYLFGISVMDIDDYLEKCPLADFKNSNIKEGIVIVSLEQDSPLLKNGINQGDVLLEFNSNKILNKETFKELTKNLTKGNTCLIKYHQKGQEKQIEIII